MQTNQTVTGLTPETPKTNQDLTITAPLTEWTLVLLALAIAAPFLPREEAVSFLDRQVAAYKAAFPDDAERIARLAITIPVQAGEDDKLYGAVHESQMLEALAKEGITLEKDAIALPEPIKSLGVYDVEVKLHAEVQAKLKVWVVRA